ncbi:MAG: hypothetical protein FJ006_00050 [Chloroflexi bacterium]|nr:hypothetical protein [Chloroflexota bacterium]
MAKQLLILTCEICGEKFEAHARRKIVHCRKCAEKLRRKRLGSIQIRGKPVANAVLIKSEAKEIHWERSEKDLIYYLKRFNRFPKYDCVVPSEPDKISDEDRRIANQIAARMSAETWAPIVGESIAQIGDWDLFGMNDLEWQSRKGVVHDVLAKLLRHSGIGVARLTKALHRKRPKLIPICDSVLLEALRVDFGSKADRIVTCMDRLRIFGRKYFPRLQALRELSKHLQTEMTELRMLELLYWVQFGPFPPTSKKS